MPKPRNKEHLGLPKGWRHIHGAYYYRVPAGLEAAWDGKRQFRLGSTLPEAYAEWARRLETTDPARTVAALMDRYVLEAVPLLSIAWQRDRQRHARVIRAAFGAIALDKVTPQLCKQYRAQRIANAKARAAKDGPTRHDSIDCERAARQEIACLSAAMSWAADQGMIERNQLLGTLRLPMSKPKERYVEDWEIAEALSLRPFQKRGSVLMIQCYIRLKLLMPARRSDLLRLQVADFGADGILIRPHKTASTSGKATLYTWTPELRQAIDDCKAARPVDISPWLFCTSRGQCYYNEEQATASGWDSMWQRFMARVLAETTVAQSFTDHDIRAKVSSDADSDERARALLSHSTTATTRRHYRRKAEKVQPAGPIEGHKKAS